MSSPSEVEKESWFRARARMLSRSDNPVDDCEGIPTGSTVAPTEPEPRVNNEHILAQEFEELKKRVLRTQIELDRLKKLLVDIKAERAALREQVKDSEAQRSIVPRYRKAGLPAQRAKRIPSKNILFKGQKRKQV